MEAGLIDTRRVATLENYSDMFTKARYIENLLPTISGYALKPLPAVPKVDCSTDETYAVILMQYEFQVFEY